MDADGDSGVALVMGGSRGLGLACALELADQCGAIAICGRTEADVVTATKKIEERGGCRVIGLVGDVSKPDEVQGIVTAVREALGPIQVLVANAGGPAAGSFFDVSDEDWDSAYRLTLGSVVVAIRSVLPDMRIAGTGRIIVIGSSSIRRPIPNLVLSNTFRAAVNGLVKDLATSLASEGITVNMVAPGRIDTERVRELDAINGAAKSISAQEERQASEQKIPAGRYGTPKEFAAAVAFLASQDASYITGQSLLVDGGLVATVP